MSSIGFKTNTKEEEVTTSNQIENYEHKISMFGIPVIKITKYHKVDTETNAKA